MEISIPEQLARVAWRTALIYAAAGAVWIVASDRVVHAFWSDPTTIEWISVAKGWGFVLLTAVLLFLVLQRMSRRVARDFAERKRAEDVAQGNQRIMEMIATGAPVATTLEALANLLEQLEPEIFCSILLLDAEGRRLRSAAGPRLPAEYAAAIDGVEIGPGVGSCGTAAFRGERVVVSDIATDPLWAPYKHLALRHGLLACWSTPFTDGERRVLGTFAVYYKEVRRPDERHIALVEMATHAAAICVSRHRAEAEMQAGAASLREARDRLRSALEIGGIGTFVVDFSRNETIWDESLMQLYGCAWNPADGASPEAFLRVVHPEDRESVSASIRQVIVGEVAPQSEYRIQRPDGTIRWVATTARAECDPAGKPVRLIGATVDVTARKTAELNFRQAQKLEAIGQLAGGVAHDFNNILTVIQAGVSFLGMEKNLSPSAREFVAEIKSAAVRATNLTRQLLTFSRRQAMQLSHLEFNAIVTNISRMLQRVLGEHIRMDLSLAPQELMVLADAGMMEQVMMNLAVNARDAMPRGGRLAIATRIVEIEQAPENTRGRARSGEFVCLEVTDDGQGIAPAVLPHIFEPFFTTKEAGRGTGLGLATVQGIIEQHGGWVEVDSTPGHGSSFRVYLPRLEKPAQVHAPRPVERHARSGSETILLVEDEGVVRALIRGLLSSSGYDVIEAATGPRAVELWNESGREVDLLLTDLVMPEGMSGSELAERLRRDKPALAVVFMSGYGPDLGAPRDDLSEIDAFLPKPFDLETLIITLRRVLDQTQRDGAARGVAGLRR